MADTPKYDVSIVNNRYVDHTSWPYISGADNPKATYAVDVNINGQQYTFIPDSTIQKGVTVDYNATKDPKYKFSIPSEQYYMPWFMDPANQEQLKQVGKKVDLSDSPINSYLKDKVGSTSTGFLVPTGAINFDENINKLNLSVDKPITGLSSFKGTPVYAQGDNGFIDPTGGHKDITITHTSSGGGGLFGSGIGPDLSWTDLRDSLESAGVLAGNYLAPGSGLVTSQFVSEGSKDQLSSGAGQAAMLASGLGGGLSNNLSAGTQAGQAAGLTGNAATAAGNAALTTAATGDLGKGLTSSAIGGASGAVGSNIGNTYGQVAGQLAGGTTAGLLQGQNLGTAAGNAALTTGAYQAAGGLLNAGTPAKDYSTGANYDLTTGQNIGGLGLKADLSNIDYSNPYALNTTSGNIGAMGGGQGIQVPTEANATLGSIGADATASTGSPTANPALQNLLSKLLLTGITGTTGTNNMATTTTQNNNLLGSLLGGTLTGAGGLMQGSTSAAASQAQADALRQAGQLASQQAQFRPVGTTTTFGTSNFAVDPTTGQLTSAGYTLSPQLQAYQDQIMGANRQSLNDAATLQNLGRSYIGQNPQEVAQNWLNQQQALLAPGRDVESARLANQLQQTGRTGVSVAQGGNLGAANPEMQALANARAMQDAQLAANAQQFGQQQVNFGQGLLSNAYQPFNAGLSTASNVEQLGQQPLGLSSSLAQQSSASGARAGQLGLTANTAAANAALGKANYNPFASALSGLGGSSLFGNALGSALGNTGIGSALGSWLGSLNPSFSDLTGWSNGGNGVVTLPDGTNVNLTDYFNQTQTPTNSFDTTNLSEEDRKNLGL